MNFFMILTLISLVNAAATGSRIESLSRSRRDLIGWNRGINNSMANVPNRRNKETESADLQYQYIAHMAKNISGMTKKQKAIFKAKLSQIARTNPRTQARISSRFARFIRRH